MKDIKPIQSKIAEYQKKNKRIFATSSFQSHSIPLLHLLSKIDNSIPIYYLNTAYLFPETIQFKDDLANRLGMNFIPLRSPLPKSQQRDKNGQLLFTSDPDYCCYLNKTLPLEPLLKSMDVWINGIRADQNSYRAGLKEEEATPQGALRYHPLLEWSSKDIHDYRVQYDLPAHPLEKKGYLSIGCEPCTRNVFEGNDERSARWFGMNKIECGIHTDLIKK